MIEKTCQSTLKFKGENVIRKINGCIYNCYLKLKSSINYMDNKYGRYFLQEFCLFKSNINIDTYLALLKQGTDTDNFHVLKPQTENVIKPLYYKFYFAKIKEAEPNRSDRAIKDEIRKHYYKHIENILKERSSEIFSISKFDSRWELVDFFKEALTFDPDKGLLIDTKKFLSIYDEHAKKNKKEAHKKLVLLVRALNKFAGRSKFDWEKFNDFFLFDSYKYSINKECLINNLYKELV